MMRITLRVRDLFLLLALMAPTVLCAQFQEPTQEELKMTAEPKAPGAAAIYLYREEIADPTPSFYFRIKVLTEKGKDLATVRIPFRPGVDIISGVQGRTIHADGTVIPLNVKPEDLMQFKTKGFEEDSVVFTLPGVEVGSILEYRYRLSDYSSAPTWWIQHPYFVRKAHYVIRKWYTNLLYTASIGSGAKVVEKDGGFMLDVADVPPEPDEDWMPPINALTWRVEFYPSYSPYILRYSNVKDFWRDECNRWALEIKGITNPSGHLKKDVVEIIAPGDSEQQKAIKIYDAVQKLDNTDFSRRKSKAERKKEKLKDINSVEDVWKQKSGSGDDLALLYAAMARAAGLKAWPMLVVNRDRAIFDEGYLYLHQFDDYIVDVVIDGKDVYVDPGQKMCPFGSLNWKHTFAAGLQLTEKGAVIAHTRLLTYKESSIQRSADLSIDDAGSVKGTVRVTMTGQQALRWRQLALENDESEVRNQFIESMRDDLPDGIDAQFDQFSALDDSSQDLVGIVEVSGSLGSATGKHCFLPGLFFESRARHPFVAQDKRSVPVDVHFPEMIHDEVTYHLPPGFSLESTPADSEVPWPDHAQLKIHFKANGSSVSVGRILAYNFTVLDPKDYHNLHDFYLKVATADQQQLVLSRAPIAKGN
jgi:transglutaminase-like putative cysteine protease